MRAYERLLNYVKIYTTSDEESTTVPSTARQFDLAKILVDELQSLGVTDARVDDKCYVYGTIPATAGYEDKKSLGFIAHMDTAPDFTGENVNPIVEENYDGEDVVLGTSGRVISVADFPHLKSLKGRTLIHTDGTTLLGADDKSGIAEIMTFVEELLNSNEPHGKICIGFTPDEEIGAGADHFDVKTFGADFAYTVDGGEENAVEYENFNAAGATVKFNGVNIHPGDAKDIMVNAALVAMEFNAMLPPTEVPSKTSGYEGFFHLTDMSGEVSTAKLSYIIRDHDEKKFADKKKVMEHAANIINQKYGEGTCVLEIKDQYQNMLEKIKPHMFLIDYAFKALEDAGENPKAVAIRGGTDGARLSFMGLPCPNLGTGGYNFHGPMEHITAEGMDTVVKVLHGIARQFAE
ncbi:MULTISPECIES: peptidase T [Pseudobutyrivibrio]|jgi:tripeptide aminopeptidase|uniref:Peptidase T n=1 Tax=Pseudobutyrivibrio ruminis TaxID=46206 RepID=A0A2G3DYK3_9FIRM|nr:MULTISPECIES: peptidase T [Pseudobutyrivibrio]PHU36127.1 peptidase T [Pseudobutyrivibrio ruminis]SCX99824.1 tripeptide aminopeptidase [Pseudobutyrivibrio sp. AR14]